MLKVGCLEPSSSGVCPVTAYVWFGTHKGGQRSGASSVVQSSCTRPEAAHAVACAIHSAPQQQHSAAKLSPVVTERELSTAARESRFQEEETKLMSKGPNGRCVGLIRNGGERRLSWQATLWPSARTESGTKDGRATVTTNCPTGRGSSDLGPHGHRCGWDALAFLGVRWRPRSWKVGSKPCNKAVVAGNCPVIEEEGSKARALGDGHCSHLWRRSLAKTFTVVVTTSTLGSRQSTTLARIFRSAQP